MLEVRRLVWAEGAIGWAPNHDCSGAAFFGPWVHGEVMVKCPCCKGRGIVAGDPQPVTFGWVTRGGRGFVLFFRVSILFLGVEIRI